MILIRVLIESAQASVIGCKEFSKAFSIFLPRKTIILSLYNLESRDHTVIVLFPWACIKDDKSKVGQLFCQATNLH